MNDNRLLKPRLTHMVALGFTLGLGACAPPPELPPGDSMELGELKRGAADAQAAGAGEGEVALTQTHNVDAAAAAVGLVTLGVNAALLTPRLVMLGVLSERPRHEGTDWIWSKTFPLAGWSAELTGRVTDQLELEMRVTGLRGDQSKIQNFLWYTGAHESDHGQWVIYSPEVAGPVVNIDWKRVSATDKDVKFTNVNQADQGNGDTIAYSLKGNVASMAIHDARNAQGVPVDFSVAWNVVTGSGKMDKQDGDLCWDTLANGQVDIACPSGTWPTP